MNPPDAPAFESPADSPQPARSKPGRDQDEVKLSLHVIQKYRFNERRYIHLFKCMIEAQRLKCTFFNFIGWATSKAQQDVWMG